ncbi:hypothetical protein ARMGADRAFT_1036752 [Armillaria gallica]|uniref:Uncharacterized protein n=1 Tax=Armillaria gallica TaxID=47427 RepID=A0A2H3CTN7_ARMGA|nr:hypothetical protein ARMGADRAFT_1036752 [Armillaria gallica]
MTHSKPKFMQILQDNLSFGHVHSQKLKHRIPGKALGKKQAMMHYLQYDKNVVQHYRIEIPDEAKQHDKEKQAAGKEPKICKTRSDKGKTWSDKDKHAKKQRKSSGLAQLLPMFISNEFVDDDDDDD